MNYNPFTLENKTILVTGASSGMGKSISVECSKMGASLVISGRNEERLNETFNLLEGNGHSQIIADLQNDDQTKDLINKLPVLDGIVHSAGIFTTLPFSFITKGRLEEILSINFLNPTLITQQILVNKKIYSGASIVWISSISGVLCSSYGSSMYSSTKGAINGMIKGMALDLAPKKIRVNSVNAGVIETPLLSDGIISDEQLLGEINKYPLKRYGKPNEVAYAVIYLLSEASSWVTGSSLIIDGGYTLL